MERERPRPTSLDVRRGALFLLFGAGLIYNLNLRGISSGDNVPGALLPFAVIIDHTIALDRYDQWLRAEHGDTLYFMYHARGHAYSRYPIGLPLLVMPAYAPVIAVLGVHEWSPEAIHFLALRLEKLAGSGVAALSVVAFFLLAVRLTQSVKRAYVVSAIYAFATPTWSISSQALWQHGGTELAILLALLALHSYHRTGTSIAAAAAGAGAAVAAAIRPTGVLFVLALFFYWVQVRPRRVQSFLWFVAPIVLIGAALAAYNVWVFQDLRGGYGYPLNGDPWSGLAGMLISPNRGLLVFCPFLGFAVLGVVWWVRQGRPDIAVYFPSLVFAVLYTAVLAKWPLWLRAEGYGPRLLTDVAPVASLFLLPAWPLISRGRISTALFAASSVFAGGLQAIGAFWYPRGDWYNTPVQLSKDPTRLWDWRDNLVWRSLRAGPELRPHRKLYQEWFH